MAVYKERIITEKVHLSVHKWNVIVRILVTLTPSKETINFPLIEFNAFCPSLIH